MFILLLPVLITIALGYILRTVGFLSDGMVEGFKKVVINITLPALIVSAFLKMKFEAKYLLVFLAVFLACALLLVIANGIAKIFKIRSPYFPFLVTGFESGLIGYALYTSFYGANTAADFGVVDVGQVLFVFIILVPMVMMAGSQRKGLSGIGDSLKVAVKSPLVWAIIIGVLLSVFGMWKYAKKDAFVAIDNILSFVAMPTTFLICLIIGSRLKFSFRGIKMELITCAVRIAFTLLLAFVIKYLVLIPLDLNAKFEAALFIMFVLPGPFVIPMFVQNPSEEDRSYVSNTLSIGTLISLVAVFIVVLVMK